MLFLNLLCVSVLLVIGSNAASQDYYEMFGIAKDATNRDIRKAFKKLALSIHPDKNPNDPDADAKFIKITLAYEVLKDTESRKRYDLYGEEEMKPGTFRQQTYQSWSYYHDQFGIYDDDPEVITLNEGDFETTVQQSRFVWFVNFYSSHCSHCHHLSPSWRRLARTLKGIIRVSAVNCDEDWNLCRLQGIRSYPTLILYPNRERYQGERDDDSLTKYVLANLEHVEVCDVTTYKSYEYNSWVMYLCETECEEDVSRLLVAAHLNRLVSVGTVNCELDPGFCDRHLPGTTGGGIIYYDHVDKRNTLLKPGDASDIADQVLLLLPQPVELDGDTFEDMKSRLVMGATGAWLVHFDIGGTDSREDLEWRKLPALVPMINLGQVHCARHNEICARLHVRKYPTFMVLKPGGAYEIHHGRTTVHDVADFAADSADADNMVTLTGLDFFDRVNDGTWVVDFFAPWCPPCLRLMPELRTASGDLRLEPFRVHFASVDCTAHEEVCARNKITAYPTTLMFNYSQVVAKYKGAGTAIDIAEFLLDILVPVVTKLTESNFYTTVGAKTADELWIVDFMAPWCGPCQQLEPEWRRLAKMMVSMKAVKLGVVNCEEQAELCSQQAVKSYPTIRLYPLGSEGLQKTAIYSGVQRDAFSLRRWLVHFLPSSVLELDTNTLQSAIRSRDPWLVVFQAPWCGHCVSFEPEFILVTERLGSLVKSGKMDCERYRSTCKANNVQGYPSVVFYAHGHRYDISSQSGDEIVRVVRLHLQDNKPDLHDEL